MASPMNKAWWAANKAKTLSDPGDTVLNALAAWDVAKQTKDDFDKVEEALNKLARAAQALKSKANRTLHGATIAVLDEYTKNCNDALARLKQADGKAILNNIYKLPKSTLDELKQIDAGFWGGLEESLLFLHAMGSSGKGTPKVLEEFIRAGSPHEINISGTLRNQIIEAVTPKWDHPSWAAAVAHVKSLVETNVNDTSTKQMIERSDKRRALEALKKL